MIDATLVHVTLTHATLVHATLAHAPVLAAIHAAAEPARCWSAGVFALQLGLPGAFCLLDPAGAYLLARVAADEAEILSLATAPGLQRQGRAARLLRAARTEAAGHGATSLVLEVAVDNVAARGLYTGAGFATVGHRAGYYGPGADALILRVTPCAP